MQSTKCSAYPLGKLACSRQHIGFDDFAPGVKPFGSIALSHRLCLGDTLAFD